MFYNLIMKRNPAFIFVLIVLLAMLSCAPVLRKDVMDASIRDFPLSDMRQVPGKYTGKLFVLGGVIISSKATAEGSLIEALYVPVDAGGYLQETGRTYGRFYALFPRESGLLDPIIFRKDRQITFAGEFLGIRQGKIDEMDYGYPLFRIREIYLWEERNVYYIPPPYYEPYPPWWGHHYWWRGYPYWWKGYGPGPPPPYWW